VRRFPLGGSHQRSPRAPVPCARLQMPTVSPGAMRRRKGSVKPLAEQRVETVRSCHIIRPTELGVRPTLDAVPGSVARPPLTLVCPVRRSTQPVPRSASSAVRTQGQDQASPSARAASTSSVVHAEVETAEGDEENQHTGDEDGQHPPAPRGESEDRSAARGAIECRGRHDMAAGKGW